jgi:hypothetical protein
MSVRRKTGYRKIAFETYEHMCAVCGFGIEDVLEVAHMDGNRKNNDADNLAILCPNCHKMLDIDIFPTETVKMLRDRPKKIDWSKRMKDAGKKASETLKRKRIAKKAAETRKRNLKKT